MARSENLSVLPQAVSTILRLADDPNVSQRELEKAFESDPAIAAKILRVANSAFYGGNGIPTIGRAITFLGISAIRSLVVGVAFQQAAGVKSQAKKFDKIAFWRHSLASAIAARILGKLRMPASSEELYCTAMLHDIGLLVLERFMPQQLDQAIEKSQRAEIPLHIAEKEVMGFDHAEVGGLLAKRWGLSPICENGIRYNLDPSQDKEYFDTTVLITWADYFACETGHLCQTPLQPVLSTEALSALEIPEDQIPVIHQVVITEVEKACSAFQIAA